jgi:hypothetical protein
MVCRVGLLLFFGLLVCACSTPKKTKPQPLPRAQMLSVDERAVVAQSYLSFYRFGLSQICDIKNPPSHITGLTSLGLPVISLREFDPHHAESVKDVTAASVDLRTDNKDQVYRYFGKEENRLVPRERELYLILMGTKTKPQYHFCSQSENSQTNCHLDELMTRKENVCEFINSDSSVEELKEADRLQAILDLWSSVQLTKR